MNFNSYWEEKVAERRKSWVSKARWYKENHTSLVAIHDEVFHFLDYYGGFGIEHCLLLHYVPKNPIVKWQDGAFSFDKEGLKAALKAEGADLAEFDFESTRESIVGKAAPQPNFTNRNSIWRPRRRIFEAECQCRDWLHRIYKICTTVERVCITYRGITMVINRYSGQDHRFGYYEIAPSKELVASELLLEETSFSSLNIATLLLEMSAEKELREEEFKYFESLKIRQMEAAAIDSVEFTLWDDKKIEEKLKEYAAKGYSTDEVLYVVLRPWQKGVEEYLEAKTVFCNDENALLPADVFHQHSRGLQRFIDNKLQPYLNEKGYQDVSVAIPEGQIGFLFNYQGYSVVLCEGFCFFPYPEERDLIKYNYDIKSYIRLLKISVEAIVGYLKQMPKMNPIIDKVKEKVRKSYKEIRVSKQ